MFRASLRPKHVEGLLITNKIINCCICWFHLYLLIIIHIQNGEKNYYVKPIIKFLITHAAATTAYGQLQSSVPCNVN